MDAQDQCRVRPDRVLVVRSARPVRRPDLDEPRARAGEDVRDSKAVPDLDELAARDDDLPALGESRERKKDGGRVVVDDERRLGPRQARQEGRQMVLTRPTLAVGEVVLEVRVAGADLGDSLERGRGERRAAEIRVHEHSGRIQHPPQGRPPSTLDLVEHGIDERSRVTTRLDLGPRAVEHGPCGRDRERAWLNRDSLVAEQLVDRRQVAKGSSPVHARQV